VPHGFPEVSGGDDWEETCLSCQVRQALGRRSPGSAGLHSSGKIPANFPLQSQLQGDRRPGGGSGNARSDLTSKQPESTRLLAGALPSVHQLLHRTCSIIGRSAGGEVPLHPGGGCGSGARNSGRHPGKPPLAPAEKQSQSIWLTCTMERVATVRVVLNA